MKLKHEIRVTRALLEILDVFYENVATEICGADIWARKKIGSGSRYPILARLEAAGWLSSRWEDLDPQEAGRPRKRLYRLTMNGQAWARSALEENGYRPGAFEWKF